jgi:hypothetical protein
LDRLYSSNTCANQNNAKHPEATVSYYLSSPEEEEEEE